MPSPQINPLSKNKGSYGKLGRPPKDWKPQLNPILKIKKEKIIITFH
tara:strand:+ start:1587 stop:1727 length:141 start_codon:yes stop_codon:yes gene_type:complete